MRLHWSDIAEADLDDIYDYITRDVPYYAELFVERLIEATDRLEDHPRSGRDQHPHRHPWQSKFGGAGREGVGLNSDFLSSDWAAK